jgi:alpha-beta hydrolase superfamily lysophospholipase
MSIRNRRVTSLGVAGLSCFALLIGFWATPAAQAQRQNTPAQSKKKGEDDKAAKKGDAKKETNARGGAQEDRTKPQLVDLETDDGVMIAATYFPPLRPGKDVPVVLLLHGFGEKQSVFFPTETENDVAFALQDKGFAVLTFDFRGHGHSTRRVGNVAGAEQKAPAGGGKLDFNELRAPAQFMTLINDVETAKRFLLQKNNAGEINVAKLGVVGSEMGASIGLLWAFRDWQYPTQAGFSGKQGQDVQTLVLISPQYNLKGLAITKELTYMQQRVPMHVVVGKKEEKSYGDAKKMYQAAVKARPSETDSKFTELNTKVQGGKLLNPDLELDVGKEIVAFLDATLKKKPIKWEAREVGDGEKTGS